MSEPYKTITTGPAEVETYDKVQRTKRGLIQFLEDRGIRDSDAINIIYDAYDLGFARACAIHNQTNID